MVSGSTKRRAPWWPRLAAAVGALLLTPALAAAPAVRAAQSAPADLAGPLNVLLIGIDPRGAHTAPLADTIVVAHVPADRHGAYLFSLPRDLVVQIPDFPAAAVPTRRAKINAAMALGSRTGVDSYDPAQGYRLLAQTVQNVTGIPRVDAGAILTFGGFTKLVQAMGGIRMRIDQEVVSEHRKPDGSARDRLPECRDHQCLRPYIGVQKIYPQSAEPVRLRPWEALDFVRQRYGLPGSDYDRQRHQRQFLKAMTKRAVNREVATDPAKLMEVLTALGDSLTFAGSPHSVPDWAAELRTLRPGRMTTIGLPGEALFEDGRYVGEQLPASTSAFFAAVTQDRVAAFLVDNPGVVTVDPA